MSCSPSRCGSVFGSPRRWSPAAAATRPPELYALALIDVETLTRAPHNIATLYLMPEIEGEEFAPFRTERQQLQAAYGRLGRAAAPAAALDEALIATLLMQVVESVVQLRRSGYPRDSYAPTSPDPACASSA